MQHNTRVFVKSAATVVLGATLFILPGGAAATRTKPEEVGFSSERLGRIHQTIQRHIEAGDFSGAVTLVAKKGRVAHLEAQGRLDLKSNAPMTEDAIFRIASMT